MQFTGRSGRPSKVIDSAYLREAMAPGRNISLSLLARSLGMHRHTVRRNLLRHGLSRNKHSNISDTNLDQIVRAFKQHTPDAGVRYLIGFLRRHGLRIQKYRIYASLQRVDGLGQALRRNSAIRRREYHSPRPNALWHSDGHHKLIHWGIVVHGFIDGFCRTVGACFLTSHTTCL